MTTQKDHSIGLLVISNDTCNTMIYIILGAVWATLAVFMQVKLHGGSWRTFLAFWLNFLFWPLGMILALYRLTMPKRESIYPGERRGAQRNYKNYEQFKNAYENGNYAHLRKGQAFCNLFGYQDNTLFYSTDENEISVLIARHLIEDFT